VSRSRRSRTSEDVDHRRVNVALVVALGLGLLLGALFLGLMFTAGCSENLHAGTARKDVCDAIGDSAVTGWSAVLWPVGMFGASRFVPWFRGHVVFAAMTTVILAAAFWIPVLMIVSSNWLAD